MSSLGPVVKLLPHTRVPNAAQEGDSDASNRNGIGWLIEACHAIDDHYYLEREQHQVVANARVDGLGKGEMGLGCLISCGLVSRAVG